VPPCSISFCSPPPSVELAIFVPSVPIGGRGNALQLVDFRHAWLVVAAMWHLGVHCVAAASVDGYRDGGLERIARNA
jgi:hypothetical protein